VLVATKLAAYPWRLTPGQFVSAVRCAPAAPALRTPRAPAVRARTACRDACGAEPAWFLRQLLAGTQARPVCAKVAREVHVISGAAKAIKAVPRLACCALTGRTAHIACARGREPAPRRARSAGARCGGWAWSASRWGSCTGAPRGTRRCRSAHFGTAWPRCMTRRAPPLGRPAWCLRCSTRGAHGSAPAGRRVGAAGCAAAFR